MNNISTTIERTGSGRMRDPRAVRAFTLIELLVVIAITAILLTVIFRPLISSFELTSRATTQIQSQAAARSAMDQIQALLGNAAYVFDNSGLSTPGSAAANTSLNIWLQNDLGAPILVTARHSMVEYVPAAKQLEQVADSQLGAPIDPTTGEPIYDPFASASQSGVALPVLPGRVLGRIFVGLSDNTSIADAHAINTTFNPYDKPNTPSGKWSGMPAKPYGNRYEDPRTVSSASDNRYTVWNAEAPIYIVDPTGATKNYVPNLRLFHIKDKSGAVHDVLNDYTNPATRASMGLHLVLHDPNFFYDAQPAGDGSKVWAAPGWVDLNGDGQVEVWENWHATATNLLGNARKIDMVALDRDPITNLVQYFDNTGAIVTAPTLGWPHVRPLVRFAPATVQNDAAVASALESAGNESPSPVPTLYATQFTHWSNPYRVLVYRAANGANPLSQGTLEYYETTDDGRIVHVQNLNQGATPPDPTTLPDVGPMIDPNKGIFLNTAAETAFDIDNERGTINFAFPSTVLIHDANGNPLTAVFSPVDINHTADPGQPLADPPRRALSLEVLSPAANPSMADVTLQPLSNKMKWYNDVAIVPGTEVVFGPDQRPGAHYGYRIQYTRVPSKSLDPIGPNQYKLNYQNENDPGTPNLHIELTRGFMEFRPGEEGSSVVNISDDAWPGGAWDPNNSPAVDYKPYGLPEHKANPAFDPSQPNSPANPKLLNMPSDPVEVFYKFQTNRANDVVKVDYLTRELLNVTVESRLYDQYSARPMSAVLTEKLKVRNLQH
jgi:prepilin-type N-terminal cleavage/methylation domain-containing protein